MKRGRFGRRQVWALAIVASLVFVVAYAVYAATLSQSGKAPANLGALKASASNSALVGKAVPAFSLPELSNNGTQAQGTVGTAQFAGKPLVVNFFASWCTPCQSETPMVARAAQSYSGRVSFLGVDENDTAGKALKFIAAKGVHYPVVSDQGSLQGKFLLLGLPTTVFVNAKGVVAAVVQGQLTRSQLYHWLGVIART